ncbi:AzlD domain-containing protein [Streptomyces sp. NPDC002130]|uniref:AzlD domain-containing protein n=1 Tax=Streptomyces sp. NPDC002130 TaxID=3155568 RepID=UPI00332B8161
MHFLMHLFWAGSAAAGALLGSLVPGGVTGLDFALTALFVVLALGAVGDLRGDLPTWLLALLSALVSVLVTAAVTRALRDLPVTQSRAAAPLAALAVTAGLHLWRRNALLSILAGTAVHVALAGTVFAR